MNNQLLDSIIRWAQNEIQTGQYPSLAREIEIVATIYRNKPTAITAPDRAKIQKVIDYYKNVLTDKDLTLQWKLMTIHSFENWINFEYYDELVDAAMPILAKGSSKCYSFDWELYNNLFERFIRSNERDRWNEIASGVLDSYINNSVNNNNIISRIRGRVSPQQTASISELAMLETSLILNDNEKALKLLNNPNGTLKTSSCSLGLLIQYQKNDLLKIFTDSNIQNILRDTRGLYDQQMEDQLNASLQQITREDARYYTRLLLYSHRNVSRPRPPQFIFANQQDNFTSPNQRLEKLAKEFSEIQFKSNALKKNSLVIFTEQLQTLPYLEKALAQQAQEVNLPVLLSFPQSNNPENPDYKILLADKMNMLLKGDTSGFKDLISYLQNNSNNPDAPSGWGTGNSANYLRFLQSEYCRFLNSANYSNEIIEQLLELTNLVISTYEQRGFSSNMLFLLQSKMLFLILEGKDNEAKSVLNEFQSLLSSGQLSPGRNTELIRNSDLLILHQVLAKCMDLENSSFEDKMKVLDRLYSIEQVAAALKDEQGGISMLTVLFFSRILTPEEIIQNADVLMSKSVVKNSCRQMLASMQVEYGLMEDAEITWRKIVESEIKSEIESGRPWMSMQGYLSFLNDNNLLERALNYWKSYDKNTLSEKSLLEYNNLLEQLENMDKTG